MQTLKHIMMAILVAFILTIIASKADANTMIYDSNNPNQIVVGTVQQNGNTTTITTYGNPYHVDTYTITNY